MSVNFKDSSKALAILKELRQVIAHGLEPDVKALQSVPHLVLLNVEWYHEHLKPVMAQWMQLWLESQHIAGMSRTDQMAYIQADWSLLETDIDGTARKRVDGDAATDAVWELYEQTRAKTTAADGREVTRVNEKALKLLNITADWLKTFLPHTLQKVCPHSRTKGYCVGR